MKEKYISLNSEDHYIELNDITEIKNNNLLLNIQSKYNIKLLFSYLKYDYILKLIKYNKSLKKKLGICKQNYKDYSNIQYIPIEEKTELRSGYVDNDPLLINTFIYRVFLYLYLFLNIAYIIYLLIAQRKLNIPIVEISNYGLFGLFSFDLVFSFLISRGFHVFSLLFLNIIHILYEILIVVKMYKIHYLGDLYFLIVNFIFIVINFFYIIGFRPRTKIKIRYYLKKYKNIQIRQHYIENFNYFKENQKEYISEIFRELEYDYSKEDSKIFQTINNFREKNNLAKLTKKNNLPGFIKNEISEVILFDSKHLFKLVNNKYLLKYELNKFNDYFKNNNEELINVLLKEHLTSINILTQGNIQYILLNEEII